MRRAFSSTSASRPGMPGAAGPRCLAAPWHGTCRSHGWPAAAAPSCPPAATRSSCASQSKPCPAVPGRTFASPRWSCCAGARSGTWPRTRSRSTGTGPTPPSARCGQWTTRAAGTCTGHAPLRRPLSLPPRHHPAYVPVTHPCSTTIRTRSAHPLPTSLRPSQPANMGTRVRLRLAPRGRPQLRSAPGEPHAATLFVAVPRCDASRGVSAGVPSRETR